MKRMTAADARAWVKLQNTLADDLGFQRFPEDEPGYDYRESSRWIVTDFGRYILHDADPDPCFALWFHGRFETPKGRALPSDANPFSGKWNHHAYDVPTMEAVFRSRLAWVNARPPTPEEAAEYDRQDRAELAELSIQRAEFRAECERRAPNTVTP